MSGAQGRRLSLLAVIATAITLLVAVLGPASAQAAECELEPRARCFALESVGISMSTHLAGAHSDLTTSFRFVRDPEAPTPEPYANAEDITVKLPPGVIGNPNATTQCDPEQLTTPIPPHPFGECPVATQVGVTELTLNGNPQPLIEPIYNMKPPGGNVVARLGLIAGEYPTFINLLVRTGEYGVTAKVEGAPSQARLLSSRVTLWGVPAAPAHDLERRTPIEVSEEVPPTPRKAGIPEKPFITNPTRCGSPGEMEVTATTYQAPGLSTSLSAPLPEIDGCEKLNFETKFDATPTSSVAATPSGLEAELHFPQDEAPGGLATSELRSASVTLPPGMTIAPGAADGLAACDAGEVGFEREESAHCPDAAKLGSATFVSPALSEALQGSIYQRSPEPGRLFRIWLVADGLGVHVKIPGEVHADPQTGQLTGIFVDTPQLPVEDVQLRFRGGSRAPLTTPSSCGTYQTHYEFTPWSGRPPNTGDTPMSIAEGCATGGFSPKLNAGSLKSTAGSFSPFVVTLTRDAGEQNIASLSVTPPRGLLAKLAGVPLCPSGEAASGACPASSQVGTVTVATGPGPSPLWIPQPGKQPTAVYISGPYRGAPYSLVVKVPAQAGPFDLGTVVTRAAIYVDPETAQVTATSDPLPQILEGVPVSYRTIDADVDRPGFTLNPTSCRPLAVAAAVDSNQGRVADVSDGFQGTDCARLGFKPSLRLRLKGPSRRGAHPALRAELKVKGGAQANIGRASVALAHSEFLAQEHIKTICTRVQFAADRCPARSIYGRARAFTPLLDKPLQGPVYLRSSSHQLPDLVVALRGQIDIDLVARIDSVNGGIRTTFESVPDAPVSKFVLEMQGGKKGLLVNSESLCSPQARTRAVVRFAAHNGKVENFRPKVANECGKRASTASAPRPLAGEGRTR